MNAFRADFVPVKFGNNFNWLNCIVGQETFETHYIGAVKTRRALKCSGLTARGTKSRRYENLA
jgi:hypothetical protein